MSGDHPLQPAAKGAARAIAWLRRRSCRSRRHGRNSSKWQCTRMGESSDEERCQGPFDPTARHDRNKYVVHNSRGRCTSHCTEEVRLSRAVLLGGPNAHINSKALISRLLHVATHAHATTSSFDMFPIMPNPCASSPARSSSSSYRVLSVPQGCC